MKEYPHAVGDRVWLDGVLWSVTARPGPYSVTLDGCLTASVTMVKAEGEKAEPEQMKFNLEDAR